MVSGIPADVKLSPAPADAPAPLLAETPTGPLGVGGRIFCVGRNYVAHRDEFANPQTPWPELFLRLPSTVTTGDVIAPAPALRLDYEGELAVVVGRGGRHVAAAAAVEHILGFCIVDDVTARDWQRRGVQWTAGKNFDSTLPVSGELVPRDEVNWRDAAIETRVNGDLRQSARTSQFIFDLPTQLEFISSFTDLRPGDLICTGTPGGVGAARTPPTFLAPGDVVEITVEGVGTLRHGIVGDPLEPATGHWRDVANDGG